MPIRGDLLSADLSNVFQMLALNRKRGRLLVQETGNVLAQRRLYISEDRVGLDEAPPPRPLAALLVEMGAIDYEQLVAVQRKAERYHADPIHLLRQQGDLSATQHESAHRRVEEEEILEVFLWRNVTFSLEEVPNQRVDAPTFVIDHLIMEAARRQDEWRHRAEETGTTRRIFVRTGATPETGHLGIAAVPRIVLDHVDGVRGSREIMQATGLPKYFVDIALHGLQDQGLVEPLGLAELIATGDRLAAESRVEDALRFFRSALHFDRGNVTIHNRLGGAFLRAGRIAKAAAHYRFCASTLLEAGRRREALAVLATVLKMLPTDFRTVARCLEIMAADPADIPDEARELVAPARRLLAFYAETSQDESALALAENLLRISGGEEEETLTMVARLSLRLARREAAARAYSELSERMAARGDLAGAIEILRTLSSIDPARRQTYESRAAQIHQRVSVHLQKVRRRRILGGAVVSALVILGLAAGYDLWSRSAWAEVPGLPASTVADARAAADRFREFAGRFPFTPAASKALAAAEEAEGVAGRLARDAASARDAERQRRARVEEDARARFEEGDRLARQHPVKLEEARSAFEAALAAAESLGGRWSLEGDARRRIADITRYLDEGRALLRSASDFLREGRRQEAFDAVSRAASSYDLLAELGAAVLPLRLVPVPPDATLKSGSREAAGPLDLDVALARRSVDIEARRPGFRPAVITVELPPKASTVVVVLEPEPGEELDSGAPLVAGESAGELGVLVARNGRIVWVPGSGPLAKSGGGELRSIRLPPALLPSGAVSVSEHGHVACHRAGDELPAWTSAPFAEAAHPAPPAAAGTDDVIVAVAPGRAARLSVLDGAVRWTADLPAAPRRIAAGPDTAVFTLDDGSLAVCDGATGQPRHRIGGPFAGAAVAVEGGGFLVLRAGGSVVRVDPDSGTVEDLGPGDAAAGVAGGGGMVVAADGRELVAYDRSGPVSRIALPGAVSTLRPGDAGRILATLADGSHVVVDPRLGALVFAVSAPPGSIPLLLPRHLVIATGTGRLARHALP